MVSLPPGPTGPTRPSKRRTPKGPPENPDSGSHVGVEAVGGGASRSKKPEAVRYMLGCWAAMIFGELVHQALTVLAVVLDPSELIAAAKQAADAEVPEALVNASVWGSVAIMALIQLVMIGLFAAALSAVNKQKKWGPTARRLLQVFSVFFALRALMVFAMRPAASTVPMALFAVDGVVQIVVGVAGVLGLIYASQKESIDWAEAGAPPANRSEGA